MEIIQTENISKLYGDFKAVSEVNLSVRKGEIYGFLGLNGAGKTTTIRMLLGLISPSSGAAYIKGTKVSPNKLELWDKIGYLVEIPYAYPNLTVQENLEIVKKLRSIKDRSAVEQIIDKLHLGKYKNRKAKHLSLGNAQRLGLAKALLHKPEILILDEPTNGLDPAGIYEIREFLEHLAKNNGTTIFVSSHILGEVSKFANRIGIIHEGKLIHEVDANQLTSMFQKHILVQARDMEAANKLIREHGFQNVQTQDDHIRIGDNPAIEHPEQIASIMVNSGLPPTLLRVVEEDLESFFLRTIQENGGVK